MIKQFYFTHRSDPVRCFHSGSECTWKQWWWRGNLHSSKRHDYWSLTIRVCKVISGHSLQVGFSPMERCIWCILQLQLTIYIYIYIYIYILTSWYSQDDKFHAFLNGPLSWSCKIHGLHFCRGARLPYQCPGYDTKQSDGELWGMQNNPLLLSLPGPHGPGVAAPERVLSMG